MPSEQSIQVEVFVYGTIAVDTSKREVRSVLQSVERLVRAGRTGYAAGSCEEIAFIVVGGAIWSEQSVELWERTIAETGGWRRRRRRGRSRRRSSSGEGSSRGSWSTTKGGSRSSGGGSSSSLTFLDFFVCRGDIWLER
jgi:uncharacterized membrane protein YgcG